MKRIPEIFLLLALPLSAQFRAGVQGVILDSTGAVIPGATVTLSNNETQRTQKTQSSGDGFYAFSGLPPGTYTLSAEKTGLSKLSLSDVQIGAEEIQGRNLTLTPGDLSQTITVSDNATAALETENGDVGKSITTEEIQGLPQVGRSPYELLRLTPGVFGDAARGGGGSAANLPNTTGPGGSNYAIFQTENQVPVAANGQRLSENSYQIDGVSVNSLGWGGAAVVTPNQESVKELRITSSTYSAEAGRNAGAQIDVVSQNGTNKFHGSGVFKYDDPKFNAFNSYGGYNLPPARVNQLFRQYAASVGGPVVKNRLFFFFSYEGLNNNSTNYVNTWVETPQYRQAVTALRPVALPLKYLTRPLKFRAWCLWPVCHAPADLRREPASR